MILSDFALKIQLDKLAKHFPHFNRNIPALKSPDLQNLLWLFVIMFILLNLSHSKILGFTPFSSLRYLILDNPQNPFFHEKLVKFYLDRYDTKNAEKEYRLTRELYFRSDRIFNSDRILGETVTADTSWQKMKEISGQEISLWQNISSLWPDYRYASLKLAAYNIEINNFSLAQKYLENILKKDPEDKLASELKLLASK